MTDTVGSTVTDRFFSSDWQLQETMVGSNTVTRNVWSPVYVNGLVLRDRDTDGNVSLPSPMLAIVAFICFLGLVLSLSPPLTSQRSLYKYAQNPGR